jgi:hypothetical protein
VGSRLNVPIDVTESGLYEIVAEIAEGPDYGDYSILVDGQPTNVDTRKPSTSEIPLPGPEVFRNYLTELYVAKDRTLGMFHLVAGRHVLSFIVMGKDPHSAGYSIGINDVVLEKVVQSAEIPDVREQKSGSAIGVVYRGRPLSSYVAKLPAASSKERSILIRAIGSFGYDAASASPELIAAVSDSSPMVRSSAAAALAQVGPRNFAAAIPALAKALSDPDPEVRGLAAIALGSMGPKAAPAVPELIRALKDPVDYVRAPAADALGAIGPRASAAVEPLAERLLTRDQGFVLNSIAYALGDIGSAAKTALPALRQALAEQLVGGAAQEAILKIQGTPVPVYHH